MNAWIDCLTSLDAPDDGMTTVHAPEGGCVVLTLKNLRPMAKQGNPKIYSAINGVLCPLLTGVAWKQTNHQFW